MGIGVCWAQPPQGRGPGGGPPGHPLLLWFDADRDGELSGDEINAAADVLKKMDANGDGKLTRDELRRPPFGQPGGPSGPEGMLRRLDRNNDGKVTKEELPERMQPNFSRLDLNGDGALDADELKQAWQQMGGPRGVPGAGNLLERIRNLDADKDGKISQDELQNKAMFDRLDRNGDGFIDEEELAAAGQRLRQRAGQRAGQRGGNGNGDG